MKRVPVPFTLDAQPRLLFWEADYAMVAAVGFSCGTIIAAWWAGVVAAAVFCWLWGRARAGGGVARVVSLFYWYLPFDVFKRVPASARRHFFG